MKTRFAVPQRSLLIFHLLVFLVPRLHAQAAPTVTMAPVIAAAPRAQSVASLDDIKNQQDLDKAITALDAALFNAYNRCDLEKFASFLADDVEFYHDQGGITLGRDNLTESVKKNIYGGDVRRELVTATLEAHYMKGYGAIEIGVHRFYHPKSNTPPGEGRFVHLWQYKDGTWKITRVLSFDHHAAK